jgi:hypothetical protein
MLAAVFISDFAMKKGPEGPFVQTLETPALFGTERCAGCCTTTHSSGNPHHTLDALHDELLELLLARETRAVLVKLRVMAN